MGSLSSWSTNRSLSASALAIDRTKIHSEQLWCLPSIAPGRETVVASYRAHSFIRTVEHAAMLQIGSHEITMGTKIGAANTNLLTAHVVIAVIMWI